MMLYKKIKELCEIKKGKKVIGLGERFEDSIRYIQIDDLRNNNQMKYCSPNNNYVYVNKNDLIIAWDGANAGTIGFGLEGAIGSTLSKISVMSKSVFPPFLAVYLQSKFDYFQNTATGATIPHISRTALENLEVPIFTIEKQKCIFDQLMIIKGLIEKRQFQIKALDELTKSLFLEMFYQGNAPYFVKIGEIIESIEAGWSVLGEERLKKIDELAVLKISAVTKGYFKEEEYKVINRNTVIKKAIYPKKGDIIFSRANTRELVGASAIVPKDYSDLILPDKLWKINLEKKKITPEYFHTVINTKEIRDKFSKSATGTSGSMLNISMQKFREVEIPLLPFEKQVSFSGKLNKISELKLNLINAQNNIEQMYNSLLQKAFKGELFQEQ